MSDNELENLIDSLAIGDLRSVLEDGNIKAFCVQTLVEEGCPPQIAKFSLWCISKSLLGATTFLSTALKSRLIEFVGKIPPLRRFLEKIAKLNKDAKDRDTLRRWLISNLSTDTTGEDYIQIDESMSLEVVQGFCTGQAILDLDETLRATAERLQDDFNTHFQNSHQPALYHRKEHEGKDSSMSAGNAIRFDSGVYKFVGRDYELNVLREFLGDLSLTGVKHAFRWLLITGPGGEGKSRLAIEFLKTIKEPWNAGFITQREMCRFHATRWRPRQPTLMIVDYPARAPRDTFDLLSSLQQNAAADAPEDGFIYPVRVLLLEREGAGGWYKQMLPTGSESELVLRHCFRREEYENGFVLPPIAPWKIAEMMRERIKEEVEPPDEIKLGAAVCRVDRRRMQIDGKVYPFPRPLFAAAVAEVLIPQLKKGDSSFEEISQGLSRDGVLSSILDRERDMRWQPASPSPVEDSLYRHENLLALATMCLGLSKETGRCLAKGEVGDLLPDFGKGPCPVNTRLMNAMGSPTLAFFNAIEPDILGEFYVLRRFEAITDYGDDPQPLCDAAFSYGGNDIVAFVVRCATDFPELTKSYNYFAPRTECGKKAARNFARICSELARRSAELEKWDSVEEWISRLEALRDAFDADEVIALEELRMSDDCIDFARAHKKGCLISKLEKRIRAVRTAFPDDEEIASRFAFSLIGSISDALDSEDQERVESIVEQVELLQKSFAQSWNIAYSTIVVTFTPIQYALETSNWTLVRTIQTIHDQIWEDFINLEAVDTETYKELIDKVPWILSLEIESYVKVGIIVVYRHVSLSGGEPDTFHGSAAAEWILRKLRRYTREGIEEQLPPVLTIHGLQEQCLRTIKDAYSRDPTGLFTEMARDYASANFDDYESAPPWNYLD